ncbi:MAG: response regulator transcription factor [Thermanaerothrix sp.]|nr:response regulator transcription factor [Thermanaerothrix sp.]
MSSSEVKILLIEGKRSDRTSFAGGLTKKKFMVECVANGSAALSYLAKSLPHLIIVDAASMRTSGRRICATLRKSAPEIPIVLIVEENASDEPIPDANVVLKLPFTLQKLINRIRPFLPHEPRKVLRAGPISLDLEKRVVRCEDRQSPLTPRLVTLLRLLMEHPGQVVDRETLFTQAWETQYMGDTRTLDVHISWLRRAIEADPRNPRYLKTIRGIGYRLDIEPDTRPLEVLHPVQLDSQDLNRRA